MKKYTIVSVVLLDLFSLSAMGGELRPLPPSYPPNIQLPPSEPSSQRNIPPVESMETEQKVDPSVYERFKERMSTWTSDRKKKLRHLFRARVKKAVEEKNMASVEHYTKLLSLLDEEGAQ